MDHMDIFSGDAFSLVSMVAAINNIDYVPGRAGECAFVGTAEGVATNTVTIERKGVSLSLIQSSARGGPSPQEGGDKANIRPVSIPQVKLESTIGADQIQGVRQFGTVDQLVSAQSVVNGRLGKMQSRFDLTLEHQRLGALQGLIKDADGSTMCDLFELFGATQHVVDMDLSGLASDSVDLRIQCQRLARFVRRNAKMVVPSTALVRVFCGDTFFDQLISREDVKRTFLQTDEQRARLGQNYAFGSFEYGGIVWENYRGTDDGKDSGDVGGAVQATVGVAPDEAIAFLTGVPGLYAEYYAPADFMETANTIGLPRYAKLATDPKWNRWVELHVQMNPLPLCLRPQTLIKLTAS